VYNELAKYLEEEFRKYYIHSGGRRSQTDFARELGISPTNLSKYMNGVQAPDAKNQDRIAAKLGPGIYDVLGVPRRVPSGDKKMNKFISLLVEFWPKMTSDEKDNLLDALAEKASRHSDVEKEVLSRYE
jgi:transcriptional regulator with XRE-family HTH domain